MSKTKYTYAVARIRALEVSLLTNAVIEQLLACKSAEQALQLLVEKGWGDLTAGTLDADEVLNKECKEVTKMTLRTKVLINDMLDTMYEAMGVGLAAPQVGILKRIVVIDIGEGPIVLINPVILETSGEQTGEEGCLSLPGKAGIVTRPNYAKVKALNEDMEEVILEGEGLLARAFCHEIDHLDGKLYTRLVEGEVHDVNYEEEE